MAGIKWLFQYNDYVVIFCFYNRRKGSLLCEYKYLIQDTVDGNITLLRISTIIYNRNSMENIIDKLGVKCQIS